MEKQEFNKQRRKKNLILLAILVTIIVTLYGLSFIRFGQAVYS
jgi:flagellar basal body-associated protein FliL